MAVDGGEIRVSGFDELLRELNSLPIEIQEKVSRSALRKAGKEVRREMEQGSPVRRGWSLKRVASGRSGAERVRGPGFLRRNIRVRAARGGRLGTAGSVRYYITPVRDAFYGRILALGGKSGAWSLRPDPWIERAWNRVAGRIEIQLANFYEDALRRRYAVPRPPRRKKVFK